nr:hydroxyproline-rich glycoprotein family protein [Tanacetum cinerariifolium]
MQQPHGQYTNASHYTPNAPQGGSFPNPNHNFQGRGWNTNNSRPGGYHGPGNFGYPGSQPHFTSGPIRGPGQGGYPSPGPGSSSSPRFSPYHGSGRGYPSPRPDFRNGANYSPNQGGYPGSGSNQGRGQWSGKSMSSGTSYGRGGGGQGQGGGGGHNHVSAEERPDMFYNKSMVEDPWKFLEPVIWKSHKKQWFPHSVGAKKPRVSESPRQQQPSSQPSLAEILAASFNEAANEEPSAG